jgi:uncharacterized protein (TIGR00251 family)
MASEAGRRSTTTWLRAREGGVEVDVLVVPRASRTELSGVQGDRLKVRLAAPPVEGKANKALVRWLAKQLGVSRRAVAIASGETGRRKVVRVAGIDAGDVLERLDMSE